MRVLIPMRFDTYALW